MAPRLLVALFALALTGCGDDTAADHQSTCSPADNRLLCGAPLLIAHRGGGALRPEETLAAFENAAVLGADILELDVHSTSDGTIVCLHDATVDRTTNGTGPVHALTLKEVKELDAGYDFTTDGGATFPSRGQGVTVPTLAEVLDAHPQAWWSIEIKQSSPSIVDEVLEVLGAKGAASRAVVVAFSDAIVQEVRQKRPDVLTGMGLGEMLALSSLTDESERDYQAPTRLVQPPASSVNAESVARAKRLGLRLHAWTVNDREEMERLLDLGTHGIMSDDPAKLGQVLSERGP
jgi:glycerophosphoryl diester phosphodiesterase